MTNINDKVAVQVWSQVFDQITYQINKQTHHKWKDRVWSEITNEIWDQVKGVNYKVKYLNFLEVKPNIAPENLKK
jgi:hypothetical protein